MSTTEMRRRARGGGGGGPRPGVNGDRLRIFIESVANVKEAAKMDSTHFTVTLVDGEGTPIEPSQNTPIGVEETAPDGVMRVHGGVTLNSVPQEWPEGSAVMLELRHYKQKEKKMSTRCWSFMEKESIRQGLFGLPLAAKPADRNDARSSSTTRAIPI